jgi:hypothetical protein
MFGPTSVTAGILDVGTRKAEDERRRASTQGSGALCPPAVFLGQPAAFDIPNVPDVSDAAQVKTQ